MRVPGAIALTLLFAASIPPALGKDCMRDELVDGYAAGLSDAKATSRLQHAALALPPTEVPDPLQYQNHWEAMHVPRGSTKSLPLGDGSRPERVLYFRPAEGDKLDYAVAHSIVNGRIVRREILQVVRNPVSGAYELRADLQLVGANGKVTRGPQEELSTCATCHSVSAEGKHQVLGAPTSDRFPNLPEIPAEPGARAKFPRWQ